MPTHRILPLLCLALVAFPARTQALPDGPAYGGSKVFSLGLNPLGNSARFDQAAPGWYVGRVAGDMKAKDQPAALDALATLSSADAGAQALALTKLADNPWAQRTVGYTISYAQQGGLHGSLTREEFTGLMATVDQDPTHRGSASALALNGTALDIRRAVVTRLVTGVGSLSEGAAYGFAFRIEDWRFGRQTRALNPLAGQASLGTPKEALDYATTTEKKFAVTLDGGVNYEIAPGLRVGATVDRIYPATFGDLKERAQARAGLQMDLGTLAQLSAEVDLNEAVRMPFIAKQKSAAVALRILASPTVQLLLGAERKTLAGVATLALGATFYLKLGGFHVGAGMRFGQDRPLLGLGLKVD